jgi:Receptor family ligand binding region/7 transmembrane sweet-taste receptor of 3 GCPR
MDESNVRYSEDRTQRMGKILTMLGITGFEGDPGVRDQTIYTTVSAFLAWRELATRSGAVLPHLPALLEGCDFHWDYEARDTKFAHLEAARQLLEATNVGTEDQFSRGTVASTGGSSQQTPGEEEDQVGNTTNPPLDEQIRNDTQTDTGRNPMDNAQATQSPSSQPSTRRKLHIKQCDTSGNRISSSCNPQSHRRLQAQSASAASLNALAPFAMIGDFSSRISKTIGILGDALGIPQISGSSTSADLSNLPLFARTIPNDDAMAESFVHYLRSLNVTHFANIYVKDAYGTSFHQSLRNYADVFSITLHGISYLPGKESEVVKNLKDGRLRYVFATVVEWQDLIRVAYDQQVIGVPGYAWYLSEKFILTSTTFALSREADAGVAQALSGIGLVNFHSEAREGLNSALMDFAASEEANHTNRTSVHTEFINRHAHPEIFDGHTFPPFTPSAIQHLYFDAVIAMGLASCQTPGLFTGRDLFQQLLKADFEGVTGRVSFDEYGNRLVDGVEYRVDNLRLSDNRSDSSFYRFDYSLAAIISKANVTEITPFLFANGRNLTTTIPASLPPVEEDLNLVDSWALALGLFLGSFVIFLSVVMMCWTWWKRNSVVVRMSQPPFLFQLCVGTAIIASTVFPLAFAGGGEDETTNQFKYNTACIATCWTISLGFVTSFSAIFSKAWRLNKLLNTGHAIRRIEVKPEDVIKPFVILLTINLVMLLGLTFVAPLEFQRVPLNDMDAWGRTLASYGTCVPSSNLFFVFLVPMIVANVVCVLVAAWQCYKGRKLPVNNGETHYLGISMASMLETILLSAPVLFAVQNQPTTFFVFSSAAVCLLSLSILIPVFLPKWLHRNDEMARGRRTQVNMIAEATRRNVTIASRFAPSTANFVPPMNMDFSDNSDQQSHHPGSDYGRMRIHRN